MVSVKKRHLFSNVIILKAFMFTCKDAKICDNGFCGDHGVCFEALSKQEASQVIESLQS